MTVRAPASIACLVVLALGQSSWAQTNTARPDARVSFYVTTDQRRPVEGAASDSFELASALTFRMPDTDHSGLEAGIDVRHTRYSMTTRPQRVSLYDGFAGARLGSQGQLRVRAGHIWLPDMGTAGALAGGLIEFRSAPSGAASRVTAGAFMGAEPLNYETGYAEGVRKYGGYVGLESGFLRRHVLGFATIKHGALTERSMLTVANYIPAGRSFFAYQALEYDLKGPAAGTATRGLSYFLVNARAPLGPRVELQGTYNKGRSIDARGLTEELLNGRAVTAQAVDGLRYETQGGRVSVRVLRGLELYAGYARDRNNRDDEPTGRITLGGYASNLFNSGFDVSGSDAMIDRPTGPYHSRYVSIGRRIGRAVYVSGDYSTSLAVVQFRRSDGVTIETRPWTKRYSGNVSATISRSFSLTGVVDYTTDEGMMDLRLMTGLTYRVR